MASFDINEKEINEKINEENLSEFVRAFPSLYDKKQLAVSQNWFTFCWQQIGTKLKKVDQRFSEINKRGGPNKQRGVCQKLKNNKRPTPPFIRNPRVLTFYIQ